MNDRSEDQAGALARLDDSDGYIQRVDATALAVMNRSEIETSMEFARRYPRSIRRFLADAETLATFDVETAESCIYTLPRGGKPITGPSVRLAEICATAYGNLQIASRVLDAEDAFVVAQGIALDLEKNLRIAAEIKRRITKRDGSRYDDDMIGVAGAAGASIARRNAIFQVIPRTYVNRIYARARQVAVGDARTLEARRADLVGRLGKMGVAFERVLARVSKAAIEDIGLDDMEILIGLGTAVKDGNVSIDDAFPPVAAAPVPGAAAPEGRRMSLTKSAQVAAPPATGPAAPPAADPSHGPGSGPVPTEAPAKEPEPTPEPGSPGGAPQAMLPTGDAPAAEPKKGKGKGKPGPGPDEADAAAPDDHESKVK